MAALGLIWLTWVVGPVGPVGPVGRMGSMGMMGPAQATSPSPSPLLQRAERWLYDLQLRALAPQAPDTRIVIVDIDERALAEYGRWPWRRAVLADLIAATAEREGARLIGLDLVLGEADRSADLTALDRLVNPVDGPLRHDAGLRAALLALRPSLDDDGRLIEVVRRNPVVLGFHLSNEAGAARSGALPPPLLPAALLGPQASALPDWSGHGGNLAALQASAQLGAGHLNALIDSDGQVRRLPLLVRYGEGLYGSLALVMARALLAQDAASPALALAQRGSSSPPALAQRGSSSAPAMAQRGSSSAPVLAQRGPQPSPVLAFEPAEGPLRGLRLHGPGGSLAAPVDPQATALVPYSNAASPFLRFSAADVLAQRLPPDVLRGKLVLVGVSAPGLVDQRSTPVDVAMLGTLVHAHLLAGLIDGRMLAQPRHARWAEAATLGAMVALLVWALPLLALWQASLLCAGLMALTLAAHAAAWLAAGLVLPLASSLLLPPALLGLHLLLAYRHATRARRQLAQLFGEYVPPELVAEMSRTPERYTQQGRSAELSMLFADVQGFSGLAERMPPAELGELMNQVFSHLTDCVREQRGTLDKYIGDAVMAFWGAPVDAPEHAAQAVRAALAMQAGLPALHARLAQRGWPALRLHIGINSGTVVVGDMGSRHRRAYTVMGDAVNLAARLQALASKHSLGLVIGDSTRRAVGSRLCLALGTVTVRGRAAPVGLWHPLPALAGQDPQADRLASDWQRLEAAVGAGHQAEAEAEAALQRLATQPALAALCRWQRGRLAPGPGNSPPR